MKISLSKYLEFTDEEILREFENVNIKFVKSDKNEEAEQKLLIKKIN